jgi:3-carboxy-cis,cis-muconate cycloisomerase
MSTTSPTARPAPGGPAPLADTGLLSPGWATNEAAALLSDEAWVQAMLDVEVALARAQAEIGMVPAAAAEVIAKAADGNRLDIAGLVAGVHATANPVVQLVPQLTAVVAELSPEAADYVHRGSTSQDILDSASMLISVRALAVLRHQLRRTAAALAVLAQRHRDTPMVGRTLTQHAVPTTFGLKAAGWLQLMLDTDERVGDLADHGLPASLGGAAGTLSAYQEYAQLGPEPVADGGMRLIAPFAAQLGLRESLVPWHAIRTPIADLAAVACFAAGALGKFAADVQVLSRTEVGEVSEPAVAGRGASSAMPQKRNPVLATMITTAARQVPPYALVLFQAMTAEDERSAGAWHAEWQPLRDCLRLVLGAAANGAELAEGLEVDADAMLRNLRLTGGAVVSERLGVVLAPLLGKAAAKRLLGAVTARAGQTGRPLADVLAEALAAEGQALDADRVTALLDPLQYTGCAGSLTDRVLARYRDQVGG